MNDKTLPVLIAGNGANSRECAAILRAAGEKYRLLGFIGRDSPETSSEEAGVVCCDDTIGDFLRQYSQVGIFIPIGDPGVKKRLFGAYSVYQNVVFPTLIHPSAVFMDFGSVRFGKGCIVSAGAMISINVGLGDFVYVNYGATVGHDTVIGDFSLINPNSTISGSVRIGSSVVVGAGASIKQGISLGDRSVLGMSARLLSDSGPDSILITKAPTVDLNRASRDIPL